MCGMLLCSTGGLQSTNKHYTRLMERLQNRKNNIQRGTESKVNKSESLQSVLRTDKQWKAMFDNCSLWKCNFSFTLWVFRQVLQYKRLWDSYLTSEKEKEWCCNLSAGPIRVFFTGCCLCADLPGGDPRSNQTQKQSLLLDLTCSTWSPVLLEQNEFSCRAKLPPCSPSTEGRTTCFLQHEFYLHKQCISYS